MIIDVIDLEFNKLDFNRSYDSARYRRGREIYDNGLVEVQSVNKIDEKSYYIDALVEGNYDNYTTHLEIYRNIINKSTCTCEDYYKGNLCKHLIATSMEVIKPHYASTSAGKIKLRKEKIEEERRRQEEIKKRREEERKRREYQDKYHNGLHMINLYKINDKLIENSDKFDLFELYNQTKIEKNIKSSELATNIKLEFILEVHDKETLAITFKIGESRMYSLNSITNLYEAYKNETEIYYGKQLRFIPKRENFSEDSRWLFDYIIKYAEMFEYYERIEKYGFPTGIGKELYIKGSKIDEFFNILPNPNVLFNCYANRGNELCNVTDEELKITCSIQKEKITTYNFFYFDSEDISEEYVLRLNITNYLVFYSDKNIYILYDKKIYRKDKDINLVRLFEILKKDDYVLIPEDKLNDFTRFVIPKLQIKNDDLPEEIAKEVNIVSELASKVLLDVDDQGNIILELKFCYNDYEFNILEDSYKTYVKENKIARNIPAEKEIIKRIFMDGFELLAGKKQFIMRNTDDIYEFLLHKIEGYMNDFEVLATDKFKNKQIKQPKISNIGVKIDNGLLELDISKINIDISEIKDILKNYSIKKKYYKLKSGDFLNLANNEDLNLLEELSETLDIDYNKTKNGIINLPINRSLYLEKLIDSKEQIRVSKNEKFTELIDNIENSEITNDNEIDKNFENKLRDYQKVGYRWLKNLEKYKFGGILADDMGLGKTLQIIALLNADLKLKNKKTSIVVCPSTLVLNWKAEVEKWCDSIKVLIINGTAEERNKKLQNYQDYDLIITSYDLLKRDVENYEDKNFKYIIADEAQYIKNSLTQNATSLKTLKGEVKFALTGTPIENSVAELWSIFDFIMPGYLYNYNKFKKKFEEPILKNEDKEALNKLKKLISPFVLRRIKKDVLTELPEKNITIMKNEMEKEQEKIYLSYLAQTRKEVAEELSDSSFEKSKFKILMLLTRLRQICCHPSLFIKNYDSGSGKLKQCLDLIVDAIKSGHKILLFSSYTSMFEIIEKELNKLDIGYFKLIGNTPVNKRIEMVDEFNNSNDVKVFLISLKAGGTGLNLTSADVVIHYDPWWNVSSENQATDRAYRIGQKNSVQVYKLITNNSIEEKINQMQERKQKLSENVLSTEETFINKMSKEEILDLFE